MSGTRYSARPALRRRDNEFLGDMAAWRREEQSDNSERLERLRRNLRKARRQELTDRPGPGVGPDYRAGPRGAALARGGGRWGEKTPPRTQWPRRPGRPRAPPAGPRRSKP